MKRDTKDTIVPGVEDTCRTFQTQDTYKRINKTHGKNLAQDAGTNQGAKEKLYTQQYEYYTTTCVIHQNIQKNTV